MPFVSLPKNESLLRFQDDQLKFHYLISTPCHPTFLLAQQNATQFGAEDAAGPTSSPSSASMNEKGSRTEVKLDPRFPIMVFVPSECFPVAHQFASQLCSPVLSSNFNLIALDPRGHGLTRDVPIPDTCSRRYDLDTKAGDCLDVIQSLLDGDQTWPAGMHIVACAMSGLVGARMVSSWPESFQSLTIASPILEQESEFMIESFQGIKELLTQSWYDFHDQASASPLQSSQRWCSTSRMQLPHEVISGFAYRWAGSEPLPRHISHYLSSTWFDQLILDPAGLQSAINSWFEKYWLRSPLCAAKSALIRCRVLVVEGEVDLPYERGVANEVMELFPNAAEKKVVEVKGAPFLVSVVRGERLNAEICSFLHVEQQQQQQDGSRMDQEQQKRAVLAVLSKEERLELVNVYAPELVAEADEDEDKEDSDDDSEEEGEEGESNDDEERPARCQHDDESVSKDVRSMSTTLQYGLNLNRMSRVEELRAQ